MSSEPIVVDTSGDPVWGAEPTTQPRWDLRQTAAAVGVATLIAALGGAAIYAATDHGSRPAGGGPHHAVGGFPPGGVGAPPPMFGPDTSAMASVHGEFVVADAGGYTTVLTQTGIVTESSPTSITVRSDDGHTQTYAMPAAGDPPALGDRVTIRATRHGQATILTSIEKGWPAGPPAGTARSN